MPLVDLHDGSVDLAIRYGAGQYPGHVVERLLGEEVIPVCSPTLLAGERPLRRPEDLAEHSLLHDDSPDNDPSCPTWPMWLRAAGVQGVDASRGPRFSQSSLVLEAAVLGHFAENDSMFSPQMVQQLETRLRSEGKEAEFFIHPGVEHAFFNDTRPEVHDPETSQVAWQRTIDHFRRVLA